MVTFEEIMQGIADFYNSPLVEEDGVYFCEIPVGDKGRSQVVYGSIIQDRFGRDAIFVFTKVGDYSEDINTAELLRVNMGATYVKVALYEETIIASGDQLMETCEQDELINLVQEVASFGDWLEENIFGIDKS
jgi:hypothetical protein